MIRTLFILIFAFCNFSAIADPIFTKPIQAYISVNPGGYNNFASRIVMDKVSENIGVRIVYNNEESAGGFVAARKVADSAPDGYTLLLTNAGFSTSYKYYPNVVDLNKLTGVASFSSDTLRVLYLSKKFKSFEELQSSKDQTYFGCPVLGTSSCIYAQEINDKYNLNSKQIIYPGQQPIIFDVAGGRLDYAFAPYVVTKGWAEKGDITIVGFVGDNDLDGIKTLNSLGIKINQINYWTGALYPTGTPQKYIDEMEKQIKIAVEDPKVIEQLHKLYGYENFIPSKKFNDLIKKQIGESK